MLQRVMIIGGPGSGKSWLARHLSHCTGLPILAIDDMVHDAGGRVRSASAIDCDARAAAQEDAWIIEGGNTRTYADRLARAEWVIRLRPCRVVRVLRVLKRPGLTPHLLLWTWRYDRVFQPKDDAVVAAATGKLVFNLKSNQAVATFLSTLPCRSGIPPSPIGKRRRRL